MAPKMDVYFEKGSKKVFAAALDWPGWSRSGRDEASALQALLDYGGRYAAAIRSARLGFEPPQDLAAFRAAQRLKGDTTTDFGSPGRIPAADMAPVGEAALRRLEACLRACWSAFDRSAAAAQGRALRRGPRGGGRDRDEIVEHILGAEHAYGRRLGVDLVTPEPGNLDDFRSGVLQALAASAHGELPRQGPRGGRRWPARYFVRRSAWHLLDHAWEIEDRLEPARG